MKGPIHSQQFAQQRLLYEHVDCVLAGWRCFDVCGTKSERFEIFYTNKRVAEQFVACNGIFV